MFMRQNCFLRLKVEQGTNKNRFLYFLYSSRRAWSHFHACINLRVLRSCIAAALERRCIRADIGKRTGWSVFTGKTNERVGLKLCRCPGLMLMRSLSLVIITLCCFLEIKQEDAYVEIRLTEKYLSWISEPSPIHSSVRISNLTGGCASKICQIY